MDLPDIVKNYTPVQQPTVMVNMAESTAYCRCRT
jgi:hypothetical protein